MAQKVIQTTVESIELGDVLSITILRSKGDGVRAMCRYAMRDSLGDVHTEAESEVPLPAGAQTALKAYITDTVLPALNTELGFS